MQLGCSGCETSILGLARMEINHCLACTAGWPGRGWMVCCRKGAVPCWGVNTQGMSASRVCQTVLGPWQLPEQRGNPPEFHRFSDSWCWCNGVGQLRCRRTRKWIPVSPTCTNV